MRGPNVLYSKDSLSGLAHIPRICVLKHWFVSQFLILVQICHGMHTKVNCLYFETEENKGNIYSDRRFSHISSKHWTFSTSWKSFPKFEILPIILFPKDCDICEEWGGMGGDKQITTRKQKSRKSKPQLGLRTNTQIEKKVTAFVEADRVRVACLVPLQIFVGQH